MNTSGTAAGARDGDVVRRARLLAAAAGLMVCEKAGTFRLFRKTAARPVFLGKSGSPQGIFGLVQRVARGCHG